jgi:hypothetical protein
LFPPGFVACRPASGFLTSPVTSVSPEAENAFDQRSLGDTQMDASPDPGSMRNI